MMSDLLSVKRIYNESISEITLGPAPANIISEAMIGELLAQIEKDENDTDCRGIILVGSGDNFSFGASVEEHTASRVGQMLPQFHLLIEKVLASSIPVMAKVSGNCLGGGFELALACHFVFADKSAKFAVPEIKLGVFPPPACALLSSKIGEGIANEMIITGGTKSAEDLYHAGLVNHLCEDAAAIDEKLAPFIEKQINRTSASSLRFATRAARLVVVKRYRNNIKDLESLYLNDLMSSNDANEGIQSFIEKRRATWTNN